MKIAIPRDQLLKAIERCNAVADSKGEHPHTGKVLLTADDAGGRKVLKAFSTDLRIQVGTTAPADVRKAGSTAVDCKRLLGVVKAMPNGNVTLDLKPERRLVVSCSGNRKYALPTVDAEVFPIPSAPTDKTDTLVVEGRILASMLARVQPSVSAAGHPGRDGVYLDLDESLSAVAVGSHTIGAVTEASVKRAEPWSALLPSGALKSVISLCNDSKQVTLTRADPRIFMGDGETLIGAVLPQEPFVPWRNGVDGLTRTKVARVPAIALSEAVRAIMAAREESHSPISVVVTGEKLRIALVGEDCKAEDEVAVEGLDRAELQVLLRPDYLMEAIRGADATFLLEDAGQSVVVSTDEYLGIVGLVDPQAWPGAFS